MSRLAAARAWVRKNAPLIGVVIALVGTTTSIYFSIRAQRPSPARLEVSCAYEISPFSLLRLYQLPVHVVWDSAVTPFETRREEIEDARVVAIRIRNVGGLSFDFEEQGLNELRFVHEGDGRILGVVRDPMLNDIPSTLELGSDRKHFTFSASFINPGEVTGLLAFHSGTDGAISMTARAKGQGTIDLQDSDSSHVWRRVDVTTSNKVLIYTFIVLSLLFYAPLQYIRQRQLFSNLLASVLPAAVGSFLVFLGVLVLIYAPREPGSTLRVSTEVVTIQILLSMVVSAILMGRFGPIRVTSKDAA